MEDKTKILTAREEAELAAYATLVKKGRLAPGGDAWGRYMALLDAEESGDRGALEAPAPAQSAETKPEPKKRRAATGLSALVPLYAAADDNHESVERWLKRLKKAGQDAEKPAPLADPVALEAWGAEMVAAGHFKHSNKRRISAAADRARALRGSDPAPAPPRPRAIEDEPELDFAPVPEYVPTADETSPVQALRRLEVEEAALHADLQKMRRLGKTRAEQTAVHNKWIEVQELLAQQRLRVEKTKGMLDPALVGEKVRRFFNAVPEATLRLLRRDGMPEEQAEDTVRRLFSRLPDEIEEILTAA